jgi:hypothetical protein
MLALKKEVLGDKGISPDLLINLTWSLVAMEGTSLSNPLLPKLLEQLNNFKRDSAITTLELEQLYQIHIFIQDMVQKHKISEEFAKVIPDKVLKAAIAEFEKVDKPPAYADV